MLIFISLISTCSSLLYLTFRKISKGVFITPRNLTYHQFDGTGGEKGVWEGVKMLQQVHTGPSYHAKWSLPERAMMLDTYQGAKNRGHVF